MRNNRKVNHAVGFANKATAQSSKGHITEREESKSAVPKERMAKAQANRKNALKSAGPSTPRGKRYSRSNALKHGFYSKELLVSDADRPEFEEMRVGLKAQLKPTKFLELAFEYVVVCHWRCKLALRLEHRQFSRQFQAEQPEHEHGEDPKGAPVIERWYGSSLADVRLGISALESAMSEFDALGYFKEDTQTLLTRGFGPDFVSLLKEWNPMSRTAILAADQLVAHTEMFADTDVKSSSPLGETTKVVIDPMQGQQMVGKLLEERRNFLRELLVITDQNTLAGKADAAQSSDFNPRFFADANRELRRALDHYFDLKNKGL